MTRFDPDLEIDDRPFYSNYYYLTSLLLVYIALVLWAFVKTVKVYRIFGIDDISHTTKIRIVGRCFLTGVAASTRIAILSIILIYGEESLPPQDIQMMDHIVFLTFFIVLSMYIYEFARAFEIQKMSSQSSFYTAHLCTFMTVILSCFLVLTLSLHFVAQVDRWWCMLITHLFHIVILIVLVSIFVFHALKVRGRLQMVQSRSGKRLARSVTCYVWSFTACTIVLSSIMTIRLVWDFNDTNAWLFEIAWRFFELVLLTTALYMTPTTKSRRKTQEQFRRDSIVQVRTKSEYIKGLKGTNEAGRDSKDKHSDRLNIPVSPNRPRTI